MRMSSLVCATVVLLTGWVDASVVEKPVVMPEALASATISDLHGFIDGMGSVAAQTSPMASGAMLKSLLGAQLNDPGLAGIAPGKGLAVVVLDPATAFAVVEVNEAQSATYIAALSQNGMQAKYENGLLVIAMDAASLAKGTALAGVTKEKLLAQSSPTLRISAQPADLYAKNQVQIDGMLQKMPMMMGMQMMQAPNMDPASLESSLHIVEGEVRFLLSLAKQCESAEIVLAPKAGSLRLGETFVPVAGSRLATLVNAPKIGKTNPKVQAGLLGDAAIAMDFSMSNPDAMNTFLVDEMDVLMAEMGLDKASLDTLKETMKKWMGLYSGSCSETVDFSPDSFMTVNYALQADNPEKIMELFKTMEKDMAPFMDLYKNMGMPMNMTFVENARKYKDVDIHQFKMSMAMDGEQQAAMQSMNLSLSNMVYDVAICKDMVLYSMGGSGIEPLIDRALDADFKPVPLKARSVYPDGGFYYCDIDVGKYMSGISAIMPNDPNNPLPQLVPLLQGADPITSAGFSDGGAVMWSVNLPGSLLAKAGQAVMMMQMQKMQQGVPGMAPMGASPGAMPMTAPGAMPQGVPAGIPQGAATVPAE